MGKARSFSPEKETKGLYSPEKFFFILAGKEGEKSDNFRVET